MRVRFRLKELLENAGLSQTDLHRISGVAYSTINGLVLNKARQVSLDTLGALSEALSCEPGELIMRDRKRRR